MGVNSNLPKDISVKWAIKVSNYFHARFSAISRRYRYIIYNSHLRSSIFKKGLNHFFKPLNINSMLESSRCLLGNHDFSSFKSKECQSTNSYRKIHHIYFIVKKPYIIIDIKANSFVKNMVRNIVGSLLEVGCGNKHKKWIYELLISKNRKKAGSTANPEGLYLVYIEYTSKFFLPNNQFSPLFFID